MNYNNYNYSSSLRGPFNRLDDYYGFIKSPKSILHLSTIVRIGRLRPDRNKS